MRASSAPPGRKKKEKKNLVSPPFYGLRPPKADLRRTPPVATTHCPAGAKRERFLGRGPLDTAGGVFSWAIRGRKVNMVSWPKWEDIGEGDTRGEESPSRAGGFPGGGNQVFRG